jgi:mono/diheme cytochrome c family protein
VNASRWIMLALLGAAGCTGKYVRPTSAERFAAQPEAVARGGYLVNQVAACGVCHTPHLGGSFLEGERTDAFLAGGMRIDDDAAGVHVAVPNLTPDLQTGLGGWTDDQILRAIRDGVRADGQLLMPPMPFGAYGRMSDEDGRAVVAYLRTVPAARHAVDRGHDHFGVGLRFAKAMGLIHHAPARNVAAPPAGDRVRYGEYLAKGIAACHDCHSMTGTGPSDGNLFAGSDTPLQDPAWGKTYARNLTPDRETGLGSFTAGEIKQALRSGRRLDGRAMAPPMSDFIPHFSGMTDDDLDAIVAYLKSLPPRRHQVPDRALTPAARRLVGEAG